MHITNHDALAATLATSTPYTPLYDNLDPERLSAAGLVDAGVAFLALSARAQAIGARVFALLQDKVTAETHRRGHGSTESEVCAALRRPPGATRSHLAVCAHLVQRYPETLQQVLLGRICWEQAAALADRTAHLTQEQARAVQDKVLPDMPAQTLAVTRRRIDTAICEIDPEGAAERQAERAQRRRVEIRPEPDGMATLSLYTRAESARAILAPLDQACATKTSNDPRTLDQRRADTLTAMILNGNGDGS